MFPKNLYIPSSVNFLNISFPFSFTIWLILKAGHECYIKFYIEDIHTVKCHATFHGLQNFKTVCLKVRIIPQTTRNLINIQTSIIMKYLLWPFHKLCYPLLRHPALDFNPYIRYQTLDKLYEMLVYTTQAALFIYK